MVDFSQHLQQIKAVKTDHFGWIDIHHWGVMEFECGGWTRTTGKRRLGRSFCSKKK